MADLVMDIADGSKEFPDSVPRAISLKTMADCVKLGKHFLAANPDFTATVLDGKGNVRYRMKVVDGETKIQELNRPTVPLDGVPENTPRSLWFWSKTSRKRELVECTLKRVRRRSRHGWGYFLFEYLYADGETYSVSTHSGDSDKEIPSLIGDDGTIIHLWGTDRGFLAPEHAYGEHLHVLEQNCRYSEQTFRKCEKDLDEMIAKMQDEGYTDKSIDKAMKEGTPLEKD